MAFFSDSYLIAEMVALMANQLKDTADFELIDEEVSGGYCLRYIPDDTYLAIVADASRWLNYTANTAGTGNSTQQRWTGIAFIFSSDWNIETHTPDGTIQTGALPLFYASTGWNAWLPAYLDPANGYRFASSFWIDKRGIVGAIQNPFNTINHQGLYFALEFIPAAKREFTDGLRSAMFHCRTSRTGHTGNSTFSDSSDPAALNKNTHAAMNLRPFSNIHQLRSLVNYYDLNQAFRSQGNSKIYFEFPTFHNQTDSHIPSDVRHYRTPIYQSRRFFRVNPAAGVAVGDVIQYVDVEADPPVIRKFILCSYDGVASNADMLIAIPYENAYMY